MRFLESEDFDALLGAFHDAFSDYLVPMQLTAEQLREMMARRGVALELSAGEFAGERMVAFTLNALRGSVAYDSGTGVAPSHRRGGLARQLLETSFPLLRERGATEMVLEVLQANESAIALYRALGFEVTRRLQCWRYEGPAALDARTREVPLQEVGAGFCDVAPSWQNSLPSLHHSSDDRRVLAIDDGAGHAVVHAATGDLALLAVDPARRRRRLGTRLLAHAAAVARKPLRILNVDDSASSISAFLAAAGATPTVAQYEMRRPL